MKRILSIIICALAACQSSNTWMDAQARNAYTLDPPAFVYYMELKGNRLTVGRGMVTPLGIIHLSALRAK